MIKDTLEKATEPNLDLKAYLQDAYTHPVFKSFEVDRTGYHDEEENSPLVITKRSSRIGGGGSSKPDESGGGTPHIY